jgi:DNA-directed RNA polymerase alpha subunit
MWIDIDMEKLVTKLSSLELITIKNEADKELEKRYRQMVTEEMIGVGEGDIMELDLSVRGYNVLKRGGVRLIRELYLLSDEDMLTFRNLGKRVVEEVRQRLDELLAANKKDAKDEIHPHPRILFLYSEQQNPTDNC